MHMLARTLWHSQIVAPRQSPLPFDGVSRSTFRVWPTDLDILRHMNNGKYLSIMDVARFALIKRIGIDKVFAREGWYPVVVGQTISYRKSLNPFMKFEIESGVLGFDDQAVYLEQRFVRPDPHGKPELYARAIVRARFLKRAGGIVTIPELIEKTGADSYHFAVPEEILEWGRSTRLPSTRANAPSNWPRPAQ